MNQNQIFIGWDVGGWNCDKNGKSRDAITILDDKLNILGKPWRGNLKNSLNTATDSQSFIKKLFLLCQIKEDYKPNEMHATIGIDTPLGFPEAFIELVSGDTFHIDTVDGYQDNDYVFRKTDQYLFEIGLKPLSPVNDMIGSQATKGIHFLRKFIKSSPVSPGVWKDYYITAIEAYPSACKNSQTVHDQLKSYHTDSSTALDRLPSVDLFVENVFHEDVRDSLVCALIAGLFIISPNKLLQPSEDISPLEGWIFAPIDASQAW